jgi:hypothetical protein
MSAEEVKRGTGIRRTVGEGREESEIRDAGDSRNNGGNEQRQARPGRTGVTDFRPGVPRLVG